MPRTQQAAKAVTGQPYGASGEQLAAQKAIPLPNVPAGAPAPAGPPPQGGVPGQPSMQDIIALAQKAQGGVPLNAPTERPGEPVTAGLPFGAGAGPEAIAPMFGLKRNQAADTLDLLAQSTGDQGLAQMAQKARMRG